MCTIPQERECVLERWRHCAYVCVSGRGVSWSVCFWLIVVEKWCWPESVDATNAMDNAGIMNKWFACRIKIYMNKNDGVAETLAESVRTQRKSPQRCHCLTYLELFSLLLVTFQILWTWRKDWVWQQSGDHTCQQHNPFTKEGSCHCRAGYWCSTFLWQSTQGWAARDGSSLVLVITGRQVYVKRLLHLSSVHPQHLPRRN